MSKEKYISFAQRVKLPIFFQPYWWNTITSNWQVIDVSVNDKEVYFIYHIENKMGFKLLRNPHLTPYSGLISFENLSIKEAKQCIQNVLKKLPSIALLDINFYPTFFSNNITGLHKRTNIIKLSNTETIYKQFKSSLKRQIRKAEKSLIVKEGKSIKDLINLHNASKKRQEAQNTVPSDLILELFKAAKENKQAYYLEAVGRHNQDLHAGLWVVFDHECMYYLLGGSASEYLGSGAMHLLLWTAIQKALTLKLNIFDFEGSEHQGIDRFFKTFGGQEVLYPVLYEQRNKLFSVLQKIKKSSK